MEKKWCMPVDQKHTRCNSHSDCGSSSSTPVRKSVQAASTTAHPLTSNISEPLHTVTKYSQIIKYMSNF